MNSSFIIRRFQSTVHSSDYIIAKYGSYYNLVCKTEFNQVRESNINQSINTWTKGREHHKHMLSIPKTYYEGPSWRKYWYVKKLPGARAN